MFPFIPPKFCTLFLSEVFVIHMTICKKKKKPVKTQLSIIAVFTISVLIYSKPGFSSDVAFKKIGLLQTAEDIQVTKVH